MDNALEKSVWYAVYTKPRWEKKVYELCRQKNITSYCPLQNVVRQWSDRKKKVSLPVFTSYIFVHINDLQKTQVRMINGIVNFVYWLGKPAVIRNEEIERLKAFLETHQEVAVEPIQLLPNQQVRIIAGPLMNQAGSICEINNKTVKVVLENLGIQVVAIVHKAKLEKTL